MGSHRIRKTEEALRESEERFRIAAESASDLIWDWDIVTDRLEWFGEVDQILGYEPGEFPRTFKAWEDSILPDDRDRVMHTLKEHLKTGAPYYTEYRMRQKSGALRHWTDRGAALLDARGVPYRMIGGCADVTDRKEAEQQRAKLETQLQQSQRMESIGRLAGGIAHDLNNLLTPILACADAILLNTRPEDPHYEEAREIKRAAELARDLTMRLLAFGRKQVLELRTIDLRKTVSSFEKILRHTIRENIELEIRMPTSPASVRADEGQLEQILLNLTVNAQEAMAADGVLTIEISDVVVDEISTSLYSAVTPGKYVLLSVSDTGKGMTRAVLDHLFEPFFTTKGPGKGTGLGLSMVYGIVKQHGGHISVQSELGQGTLFRIYLPKVKDEIEQAGIGSKEDRLIGRACETVLIVEDEETVRSVASRILKLQGYQVLVTGSASDCLELAKQYDAPIQLLLTDVIMPGMNGMKLYETLKSSLPELKVLFMSGYAGNVLGGRKVLGKGMNFIQKPFTIQALAEKVRAVLDS